MHKTPLFATHLALGADMETLGDWILPAAYGPERDAAVAREAAAARAGAGLVDLCDTSMIEITGPDLRRWVNAMFTNKYTDMQPGQGARSCIVDDRGRVQGLVDWYLLAEDRFLGVLEGVTGAWFEERFRMFLVLDDIEVEPVEGAVLLSLQGPGTAAVLDALKLRLPDEDHGHYAVGEGTAEQVLRVCRRDRTGLGGVDLVVPQGALDTTWAAASAAGAAPLGRLALDALRVADGRAAWPQDGTDKSMVHELRLETECVSFDKGCYLGQETINRIERIGGVRKKLTRLLLSEAAVPPAGAEVLLGEEVVGTVSSAARLGDQAWALATVRETAWEPGTALVVRTDERSVAATVA